MRRDAPGSGWSASTSACGWLEAGFKYRAGLATVLSCGYGCRLTGAASVRRRRIRRVRPLAETPQSLTHHRVEVSDAVADAMWRAGGHLHFELVLSRVHKLAGGLGIDDRAKLNRRRHNMITSTFA